MNFEKAVKIVIDQMEGGSKVVDDPRDPGGLTKYGISLRANPELGEDGIHDLTRAAAIEIYKRKYWQPSQASKMPTILRLPYFDGAVNHGVKGAAEILQDACNVLGANLLVDGIIGPRTLAAVKEEKSQTLATIFMQLRLKEYHTSKNAKVFGLGWERRVILASLLALS